jgi:hypothetical protein
MALNDLIPYMVPTCLWLMIGSVIGGVLAAVWGTFLIKGRPLPGVMGPAFAGIPITVAVLAGIWSLAGTEPVAAVVGAVGVRLMLPLFLMPVLGIGLCLLAVAATRGEGKRWGLVIAGLAVATLVGAVVAYGGIANANNNWFFADIRGALYVVMGSIAALCMSGANAEKGAGPEAAMTAGVVYSMFVAAGESAEQALVDLFIVIGVMKFPVEKHDAFVEKALEAVSTEIPWFWAAFVASLCMSLVASVVAFSVGGVRRYMALASWIWVALGFVLLTVGLPTVTQLQSVGGVIP